MTEVEHVFYAEDAEGAARIMDNARAHGATAVKAELLPKENVYRVEYKTDDDTIRNRY